MSKIEKSEHKESIDTWLNEGILSYSEIITALRKRGFTISKASISTYAKAFKANKAASKEVDIKSIIKALDNKGTNLSMDLVLGRKVINETLNIALNEALKLTTYAKENDKPIPTQPFRAIKDILFILKEHENLFETNYEVNYCLKTTYKMDIKEINKGL